MRLVFMGTPEFAATVLEELLEHHQVMCVYTRPDAIRERGNRAISSPVKTLAKVRSVPVRTPRSLRSSEEVNYLRSLTPDAICVAAYGAILTPEVLRIPRLGCLNVHGSLLPRWRGAAPVERAILAGDHETGVCIMKMEEGLDTGPYCVRRVTPINGKDATHLTHELAALGAQALLTALFHVEAGEAEWVYQNDDYATYGDKIAKGELNIKPADDVLLANRKVRASGVAHPSRCVIGGRSVTLLRTEVATDIVPIPHEGRGVLRRKQLLLGLRTGCLRVLELKPDGKKAMDGASFAAGMQALRIDGVSWESVHE